VRFLAPDVAVMHAVGGTILRGKSGPAPGRDSIQTLVATKHAGEWHFAAFQNTRLRIIGGSRRAFLASTLADLIWKLFRLNKKVSIRKRPTRTLRSWVRLDHRAAMRVPGQPLRNRTQMFTNPLGCGPVR
jgi:hypothetical protein